MKNSAAPLVSSSLAFLLLLLAVPLALAAGDEAGSRQYYVQCFPQASYAANGTYETNLRRLAAALRADVADASSSRQFCKRTVGYWPNRLVGTLSCRGSRGSGAACADCVTWAFRQLARSCRYNREARFFARNCSLYLSEFHLFGGAYMPGGSVLTAELMIQAIGFGWLFFLLLQDWRDRKRCKTQVATEELPSLPA